MQITFLPQRRQVEMRGRRRVRELLKDLGLLSGTVMVIRNDELMTEEDVIGGDDSIEIRSVISGG